MQVTSLFQKNLLIPLGVAAALLVTMTVIEAGLSDRFTESSVSAEDFVGRFKNVPESFGVWHGIDQDVDEQVKETAGAVGHVSRIYTNAETGEQVTLWLIVGHARDVVRHTPNICYAASGFRQLGSISKFPFDVPGEGIASFNTAQFLKEDAHSRVRMRVFWAWNGNTPGQQEWDAPDSPRMHYGNNRALYKMYFTAPVTNDQEQAAHSPAVDFGREILPLVNAALFPQEAGASAGAAEATNDEANNEANDASSE